MDTRGFLCDIAPNSGGGGFICDIVLNVSYKGLLEVTYEMSFIHASSYIELEVNNVLWLHPELLRNHLEQDAVVLGGSGLGGPRSVWFRSRGIRRRRFRIQAQLIQLSVEMSG